MTIQLIPRGSFAIAALVVAISLLGTYFYPSTFTQTALSPTVHDPLRDITYIGSALEDVEHFQNIFYAEEPSGPRRFAPPVPVRPSKGSVIDATSAGAWCPQGTGDILPFTSRVTNISENCLSLRIARPKGALAGQKLPVVVYIHGGGHALGSASDILYHPDGLVQEAAISEKPLIYVAINYRLGFFGFATSHAMIENKQTNAGLRDQRAALEWVKDNIEAFGGDSNRVTAIGQSVGASDIGLHLISFDGTRGVPFQQAMMMSGAPGLNFNSDPALVAENTASIAEKVNCVQPSEDAQSLATLECLQRTPFELLTNLSVTASRAARPPFGEGFFYPTIDGDMITARPSELLRAGKFEPNIPLIGSWVTNDGAWYAPPTTATDTDVLASFGLWLSHLSDSTKTELLALYPIKDFEHIKRHSEDGSPISPQYYRAAQMNRDIWFTCPVLDFTWHYLQKQQNGGKESKSSATDSRVWLYEHNATRYSPIFQYMGVPMWGVAHLSDIPYVLNNQGLEAGADNSPDQLELGRALSRRVIDFAYHGRPEQFAADSWPPAFNKEELRLGKTTPETISIRVFGGISKESGEAVTVNRGAESEDLQNTLESAVKWEKLFERCEFINRPQMRLEAGV
ncbi:lipase [Penicillium verhagenii]|uniref:lipase n=1 Tax=Penicillium verhagenii TaxID=1562060 RepID=UPI002544F4CC|nr:lipase [Penicillium verhagenii]KAJ5928271.1 lipase [Penicillium verhagenii]